MLFDQQKGSDNINSSVKYTYCLKCTVLCGVFLYVEVFFSVTEIQLNKIEFYVILVETPAGLAAGRIFTTLDFPS